ENQPGIAFVGHAEGRLVRHAGFRQHFHAAVQIGLFLLGPSKGRAGYRRKRYDLCGHGPIADFNPVSGRTLYKIPIKTNAWAPSLVPTLTLICAPRPARTC